MYSTKSGLILGFHGCEKSLYEDIILGKKIKSNNHKCDWLGHGMYFWENSPSRALEYANFLKENPSRSKTKTPIKEPAVLGAVFNLGYCLDLTDYENLQLLKDGYEILKTSLESSGFKIPKNKTIGNSEDLLLRELDCAVIQILHQIRLD